MAGAVDGRGRAVDVLGARPSRTELSVRRFCHLHAPDRKTLRPRDAARLHELAALRGRHAPGRNLRPCGRHSGDRRPQQPPACLRGAAHQPVAGHAAAPSRPARTGNADRGQVEFPDRTPGPACVVGRGRRPRAVHARDHRADPGVARPEALRADHLAQERVIRNGGPGAACDSGGGG